MPTLTYEQEKAEREEQFRQQERQALRRRQVPAFDMAPTVEPQEETEEGKEEEDREREEQERQERWNQARRRLRQIRKAEREAAKKMEAGAGRAEAAAGRGAAAAGRAGATAAGGAATGGAAAGAGGAGAGAGAAAAGGGAAAGAGAALGVVALVILAIIAVFAIIFFILYAMCNMSGIKGFTARKLVNAIGGAKICEALQTSSAGTTSSQSTQGTSNYTGPFPNVGLGSIPLQAFLSCMQTQPGVFTLTSIDDTHIAAGTCDPFSTNPADFNNTAKCQHAQYSCHYGGRTCQNQGSFAIDFVGDTAAITAAANTCSQQLSLPKPAWINYEQNHLHVSIGGAYNCGCD